MTPQQIGLVKNSWLKLRNISAETIGGLFYSKLFFDTPRLAKLFPADLQQQNKKLVEMLNFIVAGIENFQKLKPAIESLAIRHEGYGTKPEHYEMVGSALLWTLEKALDEGWKPETEQAWIACYTLLAQTMIDATKKMD